MALPNYNAMPSPKRGGGKRKNMDDLDYDDYTSFNFRVSKDLKEQFQHLCKKNHRSAAAAIKQYMSRAVELDHLGY